MKKTSLWYVMLTVVGTMLISHTGSLAYDINDKFSIGGIRLTAQF